MGGRTRTAVYNSPWLLPNYDIRYQFGFVHTGEPEARGGALCGCRSFECPWVYGGTCSLADPDASPCPCGCGHRINTDTGVSYAYDRTAFNWAGPPEDNTECLAAALPPDDLNASLFRGQNKLESEGVGLYSFELRRTSRYELDGILFYNDVEVDRIDGETELLGKVMAELHGMMMLHTVATDQQA